MDDSGERSPPLTATVVAGVQGAVTAFYLSLVGALVAPRLLGGVAVGSTTPLAAGAAAVGFVAGYGWAAKRGPADPDGARRATARRGAVVVHLLVLGFALPFVVRAAFELSGPTFALPFPLFGVAVAYALTVLVSYGVVYGLGVGLFPETDPDLQE